MVAGSGDLALHLRKETPNDYMMFIYIELPYFPKIYSIPCNDEEACYYIQNRTIVQEGCAKWIGAKFSRLSAQSAALHQYRRQFLVLSEE